MSNETSNGAHETLTDYSKQFNPAFIDYVIDRLIPFHVLLNSGHSLRDIWNFPQESGSCFCPFHDNTDTKAAKLSSNADGQMIYCFAEQKMFRPHDLLRKGIVELEPNAVFNALWEQLNEDTREQIIKDSQMITSSIPPLKDYSSLFERYALGQIDLARVAYGMLNPKFPEKQRNKQN